MKKQALIAVVVILVLFVLGEFWSSTNPDIPKRAWAAPASQILSPTVIAVDPASAPNDLEASVVITGADFTTDLSNTPPTASLGSVALTNVTWVNSTTLTATVPWGLDPGVYILTIVNPEGGTGSLASAFTVTQGIGQWNGGNLFGGHVSQVKLKPSDPNTVYALADGVGIFRSRDAGEHWVYVNGSVVMNENCVTDPLHPDWLYSYAFDGFYRSQNEGDSWIKLIGTWPDGSQIAVGHAYPSPHNSQVLFLSSSIEPERGIPLTSAQGLIKSTNGGVSWNIIEGMNGISVEDVAFHPTNPLQMALATLDGRVFQSMDGGDHWSEVTKPSLGGIRSIAYNPYRPTEVWVASYNVPFMPVAGKIYKSTDAAFTGWQDVSLADNGTSDFVKFASADSVYITKHHSEDGGLTWQVFGPITSYGEISVNPDNPQISYIGDDTYGVEKTTDGGQTWEVKSQGLSGMMPGSMQISRFDPLRILATFGGWPGIYRSADGGNRWTYIPIAGSGDVRFIREDPFDSQRLYVAAAGGFFVSTNGGEQWSNLGWNGLPTSGIGLVYALEPDPYQPGYLLVSSNTIIAGVMAGQLYASNNYGVSWQLVAMPPDLVWITSIAFHPQTPGLLYLTGTAGFYRSTDSGTSWKRIDDRKQADMQTTMNITIATHPQPMLLVGTGAQYPYRSLDGGVTWKKAQDSLGGIVTYMFLDGDSARLYIGTFFGLQFSSDAGDTWKPAAGVLGNLHTLALGYSTMDGHAILYAATAGGVTGTTSSMVADRSQGSLATASQFVDPGIYRRVLVPTSTKFSSASAQDGWITESGEKSNTGGTANATATTFRLGDDAAKKQYRGLLSFNTGASLPDNAVITKVTLKVRKQGIRGGGNPVKTFQGFMVDVKKGTFGTAALQIGDFQAKANKSFGPFKPVLSGGWYSINLTAGKNYINKLSTASGLTQIRLRFKLDDNNNAIANYLSLFSGNAPVAARPQLIIEYYVP